MAEDQSYGEWLASGAGIIPFPAECRPMAARSFAVKVLNRVAEMLQDGDRDNSFEADLDFLKYDYMDIIGTRDETLPTRFINAVLLRTTRAVRAGDATSLQADVEKIRDEFLAKVAEGANEPLRPHT